MNPERSHAYRRVSHTLEELGPTKLQPSELERIRYAADSLIFCEDLGEDDGSREALEDAELMLGLLVDNGRWERVTADLLAEDLRACGPLTAIELELEHVG